MNGTGWSIWKSARGGLAVLVVAGLSGCVGDPSEVDFDNPWGEYQVEAITSACTGAAILADTPADRRAIVERALDWVNRRVIYSQSPQRAGGGYRTDCSGLVSMAWGLPTPGNTTRSFAGGPWDDGRSRRIAWGDLLPGDGLNYPAQHAMLFAGWLDEAHTRFCAIEEYNWGRPASIIHHSIYENSHGHQFRSVFIPMRFSRTPPGSTASTTNPSTSGRGCYSQTLSRSMAPLACVESRFDRQWYQCVDGLWRAGRGTYGTCSSTNALARTGESSCYSNTLGRSVSEGACIQSRADREWYQCTDTGWVTSPTIRTSSAGPIGPCTQVIPL